MNVDIDALAALSNLEVPPSRKAKIAEDISEILSYIERLQTLELSDVPDPRDVRQVGDMRDDVVGVGAERARVMENFPAVSDDGLLEAHAALPSGV